MKKILLLEIEPAINKSYLSYWEDLWYTICEMDEDFEVEWILGLIVRSTKIDKFLLEKFSWLKFIFRIWTWLDNIDVDHCKSRWIDLLNSAGANADSVADLSLWGTLSLMRKIGKFYNDLSQKKVIERFNYMWNDFFGKTVTIVWFGNIGKKVYERLVVFGVRLFLIVDPFVSQNLIEDMPYCQKVDKLDACLSKTDILYLHLPLNNKTREFLDESVFSMMRTDIQIINTARWWLINYDDLYMFLVKNLAAWIYLDAEFGEIDDVVFDKLIGLDNFVITPHIGAMTHDANKKMHSLRK